MTHHSKIEQSALLDCNNQDFIDLQCTILRLLQVAPAPVTRPVISRALTVSYPRVKSALNRLQFDRLVTKGENLFDGWRVTEKGAQITTTAYRNQCREIARTKLETSNSTYEKILVERSAQLLEALSAVSEVSTKDLAHTTQTTINTTRRILLKMETLGQVSVFRGKRGKQFWSIT